MEENNIFVSIDKENIDRYSRQQLSKPFDIDIVADKLASYGKIVAGKAYFAFGFDDQVGRSHIADKLAYHYFEHGIEIVPVPTLSYKSLVDPYLICDAMEWAMKNKEMDIWVLVAGDKDYIPLMRKMSVYRKKIIVIGPHADDTHYRHIFNECKRLGGTYYEYDNLIPQEGGGDNEED